MFFDSSALTYDGSPERAGGWDMVLTADNGINPADHYRFRFDVGGSTVPAPPLWNVPEIDVQVNVGSVANYRIPRVDRGYPQPEYSVNLTPDGTSFDSDAVSIIGQYTEVGEYRIVVTATIGSQTATLVINLNVVIQPPNFGQERLAAEVVIEGHATRERTMPEA